MPKEKVDERKWNTKYWGTIQIIRNKLNAPRDRGSILDRVIPKTQKMLLDAALLNAQHYKVRIKGIIKQSREKSSALLYTSV